MSIKFCLFLSRSIRESSDSRRPDIPRPASTSRARASSAPSGFVAPITAYVAPSGTATQETTTKTPMASFERAVTRTRARYAPEVSQRKRDIARERCGVARARVRNARDECDEIRLQRATSRRELGDE